MLFYLSLLETEEQKKSFIEIYGRNRGGMYRVAYGILGQKEEAENAVHDTFVKLADKFARYERLSEKEMDGLCITIARNVAINLWHRQKRSFPVKDYEMKALYQEGKAGEVNFPEEMAIKKEEAELIRRLFGELSAADHDILVLRYFCGLSVKEVAKVLGISRNAAQVRLQRAKERLREAFDEAGV